MTTFDDISFVPHPNVAGGVWGFLTLPNGISLSIVGGGAGLYGDGIHTFEVLASNKDGTPALPADGIMGWQSKEEINILIEQLSGQGEPAETKEEKLQNLAQEIIADLINLRVIDAEVPMERLDKAALYLSRRISML